VSPFAARLRARRAILNLSQRQLAERSGVKQPLISAIESGRRPATAAVEEALERALALRPSQALDRLRGSVRDVVHRHAGVTVAVFGSVARGQDTVESDLDLIVGFGPTADIADLLAMEEELSDLLTVPVDVVSAGSSGSVAATAMAEAVPL